MANSQQLSILGQGTGIWNEWRTAHPDIDVNLRDADLNNARLEAANLTDANLSGAYLSGAILVGATLTGAMLSRATLSGSSLKWADFRGADLARANLIAANGSNANFSGTSLRQANVSEANLCEANLGSADLEGAHLHWTRFRGADLRGANLRKADISGADFRGANLKGADLSYAVASQTVFGDVDLSEVLGLDMIEHRAPSVLGLEVIQRSHGSLPDCFLRGVGVPEIVISYVPSLIGQPIQFFSCFISHSSTDKPFARRLHDALQGRGIRCWLDEKQIPVGADIYEEVDRGIRLWDKLLLCASENSLNSWWVDDEIATAFEKERALTRERGVSIRALIPLDLDGYLFRWKNGKATQVKTRLAADFTGWEHDNAKFEAQFERLVKALRTDEGREEPPEARL